MSAAVSRHKAVNEGATYRICMDCYHERRGSGDQDSKEVWECPSAAQGKSDCLCSCAPKQAAVGHARARSEVRSFTWAAARPEMPSQWAARSWCALQFAAPHLARS